MDNLDGKAMIKSLKDMQKQAGNLINSVITPEIMEQMTPEQLTQVKGLRKDLNDLVKNKELLKIYKK
jgi:CHAD domain-containing protein